MSVEDFTSFAMGHTKVTLLTRRSVPRRAAVRSFKHTDILFDVMNPALARVH